MHNNKNNNAPRTAQSIGKTLDRVSATFVDLLEATSAADQLTRCHNHMGATLDHAKELAALINELRDATTIPHPAKPRQPMAINHRSDSL